MAPGGNVERIRTRDLFGTARFVGAGAGGAAVIAQHGTFGDAGFADAVGEEVVVEVEGDGIEGDSGYK